MPIHHIPETGKWKVTVSFKGARRATSADSEVEAALAERNLLEQLRKELAADSQGGQRWTLQGAYDKCFERVWKGSKGERTVTKNGQIMLSYFGGGTPLHEIDAEWIDRWVLSMERDGQANGTINRKLAVLSKLMSFAVSRGALVSKPPIDRKKEPKGRIRFLTEAEEATLLGYVQQWNPHMGDFLTVLVDTGLRVSEGLALLAKDLSQDGRMLTVWEQKGDKPRSIPLTTRVQAILKARKVEVGRLFPFTQSSVTNYWDRARARMGLTDDTQFVPHALRHTCATRLVQRGFPIAKVKEWLGHKTLVMTMRYTHLAPADLIDGAALLEKRVTGA